MVESHHLSGVLYHVTFNQGESWLQSTVPCIEKCVTCVPCMKNPRWGFSASGLGTFSDVCRAWLLLMVYREFRTKEIDRGRVKISRSRFLGPEYIDAQKGPQQPVAVRQLKADTSS